MDNSLPIAPLFHPSRHPDILILLDASGNIGDHPYLTRAESFLAKRVMVEFPLPPRSTRQPSVWRNRPSGDEGSSSPSTTITKLKEGSDVCGTVYIPFVGMENDAVTRIRNVVYKRSESDKVMRVSRKNVMNVESEMKELVRDVCERKRRRRLGL
jgi:hypothetical protein